MERMSLSGTYPHRSRGFGGPVSARDCYYSMEQSPIMCAQFHEMVVKQFRVCWTKHTDEVNMSTGREGEDQSLELLRA